jgi:hypothetical protein
MSEYAVGAKPLSGTDRPSRTFTTGRECREPECRTRLSIYNNGKFCAEHQPLTVPRTRGRKF